MLGVLEIFYLYKMVSYVMSYLRVVSVNLFFYLLHNGLDRIRSCALFSCILFHWKVVLLKVY